jgi:hypothetical protein
MSVYYSQILIPSSSSFVPNPDDVMIFFRDLANIGATPLEPKAFVSKLTGQVRTGRNPSTGEILTFPRRKGVALNEIADISKSIEELEDYNVGMEGSGPSKLPFLEIDFKGSYGYTVQCCLRQEILSMSYSSFHHPSTSESQVGIFQNPHTGEIIEVPNAGSARFWIEFQFGKTCSQKSKSIWI